MTETPIAPKRIDGYTCILGDADTITAALRGATPLTITAGHAAGEQVWLAPRATQTYVDDAVTVVKEDIAATLDHPAYGQITAAYLDTTRLDQAPTMARLEAEHRQRIHDAAQEQYCRVAATIPSCNNCGDCRECC